MNKSSESKVRVEEGMRTIEVDAEQVREFWAKQSRAVRSAILEEDAFRAESITLSFIKTVGA